MVKIIEEIFCLIIYLQRGNFEHNFVNSIDGANALKLDESYEIKDQKHKTH